VNDTVAAEYHRGKAARDNGEKKACCDGVLHERWPQHEMPRP
jgi:hypothetical protein